MNRDWTEEQKIQTSYLAIVAAVAVGIGLFLLQPVLVPFVLALFLAIGIAPVLVAIERTLHTPRLIAVAVAFVLGVFLLVLLWILIWVSVASLIDQADLYRDRFTDLVDRAEKFFPGEPADEDSPDRVSPLENFFSQQIRLGLSHVTRSLTGLLSNAVVVLIFLFFLLLGEQEAARRNGVWMQVEAKIRQYIVTKSVISAFTGAAFGFVLWIFGVPLALVFGLLAFLTNFIPNIGPIIACLLPLPLIVLDPNLSVPAMIAVISLGAIIQFVSGNIIEPRIMGDTFELHPVVILLTLMFWGLIWGVIGMFLATPIMAAVKILLEHFEYTRPAARWLRGDFDSFMQPKPSEEH